MAWAKRQEQKPFMYVLRAANLRELAGYFEGVDFPLQYSNFNIVTHRDRSWGLLSGVVKALLPSAVAKPSTAPSTSHASTSAATPSTSRSYTYAPLDDTDKPIEASATVRRRIYGGHRVWVKSPTLDSILRVEEPFLSDDYVSQQRDPLVLALETLLKKHPTLKISLEDVIIPEGEINAQVVRLTATPSPTAAAAVSSSAITVNVDTEPSNLKHRRHTSGG